MDEPRRWLHQPIGDAVRGGLKMTGVSMTLACASRGLPEPGAKLAMTTNGATWSEAMSETRGRKSEAAERIVCRTPAPGKQPTRIDAWKFDCLRRAMLRVLPKGGDGLPFAELTQRLAEELPVADLQRLGSLSWYATTVKLELECRGEVRRSAGSPQRLWRV